MNKLAQYIKTFRPKRPNKRQIIYLSVVSLGLFVLLNGAVWTYFRTHTYLNASIGDHNLGNNNIDSLPAEIEDLKIADRPLTLKFAGSSQEFSAKTIGLEVDYQQAANQLAMHHWFPLVNFVTKHQATLKFSVNEPELAKTIKEFSQKYNLKPVDATMNLKGARFEVSPSKQGQSVNIEQSISLVKKALSEGKQSVELPGDSKEPKFTTQKAQVLLATISSQQSAGVSYTYKGKTVSPTQSDKAGWYQKADGIFVLSDASINNYIAGVGQGFGIRVQNSSAALSATKNALNTAKPVSIELIAAPKLTRTFSYCLAVRGVNASNLGGFGSKIASTLADARGWSLGGQVNYVQVSSGCSFTMWLSAASQMPTFGAICDSMWSCTASPNVVINYDRWTGASPAWNSSGGGLNDYRSMVINHEVGHWLGFYHKYCGGAGQLAPVMQQQSINLNGCKFNPWPLPLEREQLRQTLNL